MKKTSSIDLGTNSMRLLLCQVKNKTFMGKRKEMITTRIGKDLGQSGIMSEESISNNIEALKHFKIVANNYGAEEIIVIATSAVRDARNKDIFLSRVNKEVGLDIKVLDGDEEALIGSLGVTYAMPENKNVLILDVGGGSTEIVLSKNNNIKYSTSVNAGAVRMTEAYINNNPISQEDINKLHEALKDLFSESKDVLLAEAIDKVIVIGGTATTIAAIYHQMEVYKANVVHNTILEKPYIDYLFEKLKSMKLVDRYSIKGLEKERADIIPVGIYMVRYLMEMLNIQSVTVSENDNLEGAIIKYSNFF